jgi:hypothetical protein
VSVQSPSDVASDVVSAPQPERASSLDVLHDILSTTPEASVAARLHISIRTLRRYAAGTVRMNWVTHTRLQGMAAELEAKRAAEREAASRTRMRTPRKRERAPEAYQVAAPSTVALT